MLAFGSWLDAGKASAMERAVEALRARGEAFSMAFTTLSGRPIEAQGRAIAGRAVLRLKDASGVKRDLLDLAERYEALQSEIAAMRALIEKLPSPVWLRDATGRLIFVNAAYAQAVEARDPADAIERSLELLDSAARDNIAQARHANGGYAGRLPLSLPELAAASTCSTFGPRPAVPGSASTPPKRKPCATRWPVWSTPIGARSISCRPVLPCLAPIRSSHSTMPPIARCGISMPHFSIGDRPTLQCSRNCGRRANCPRSGTSGSGRRSSTAPISAMEAKEQTWHLPDGRTLRVVTTPNPDGGVTYLFNDVTERLDLDRRFEELIRVQGETLDNLAEGVAVFASNGRLRLSNAAFARMWALPERR